MIGTIEQIMKYDVAGDPMTGLKWTRRSPRKIAAELKRLAIDVSHTTVARLLRTMGFSPHVNAKRLNSASGNNRNEQFEYIGPLRDQFAQRNAPVISVDTKKREMIGNFKNRGTTWSQIARPVNDHDFRSDANGVGILYGIYEPRCNRGSVVVGTSHDTAQFAVSSICTWWSEQGRLRYPQAKELLILADNGGSNSPTTKAWKYFLQKRLCDEFGLTVTVVHYPPGASKWNPIEHRLFSQISNNWQGQPLESYETCLNYIATTRTETGLEVSAYFDNTEYFTGLAITDQQMGEVRIQPHETFPKWNYTITPQHQD